MRRSIPLATAVTLVGAVALLAGATGAAPVAAASSDKGPLGSYKHLVVIYEENHSFDNLFGSWGSVDGQRVRGVNADSYQANATQVGQNGQPLACLPQNDVNLTSPPLDAACGNVPLPSGAAVSSHFGNAPLSINDYIAPNDRTCPPGNVTATNGVPKNAPNALPGGCTRDIVHRFYNEQFQLDGGKMDRYTLGSDAMGLTQGRYESTQLPVYQYLHGPDAPNYVVADNFFQGAFSGSFLNHQFLVSGRAPTWANWQPNPDGQAHSVLDAKGMPATTPLYANATGKDNVLTQACPDPKKPNEPSDFVPGYACGDLAVNTVQPYSQPYAPGTLAAKRLPAVDD